MPARDLIRKAQDCSPYLGRDVFIEAFGHKKRMGRVCSVYRDDSGGIVCEVEFEDGTMKEAKFPTLKFIKERIPT